MKYRFLVKLPISFLLLLPFLSPAQEYSLQSLASGSAANPDIDLVVIPLGNPGKPVNVAMDFTVELWMKAKSGDNNANGCNLIECYFGDGDYGDY